MDEWVEVKASSVEDAVQAGMAELRSRTASMSRSKFSGSPRRDFSG